MTDREVTTAARMIELTLASLLSERTAERGDVRKELRVIALFAIQQAIELEAKQEQKPVA